MDRRPRFLPRYFCSVDDPEATRTWFLMDRQTGVPLMAEGGIRYFTCAEIDAFLAGQNDEVERPSRVD